jgi:hypothetical protein
VQLRNPLNASASQFAEKLLCAGFVPPADAGSGEEISGLSARLKSCPDTKRSRIDFFSKLFSR